MKQDDVGKVIDRSFQAQSFIDTHARRITDHYLSAREKHPYFCDMIDESSPQVSFPQFDHIGYMLSDYRERIAYTRDRGIVRWSDLLFCETYEALEAIKRGDKAQAVEELYDCIAVCLRAIDVLEGRQELGKQEESIPHQ